jgi:hypothetical protein
MEGSRGKYCYCFEMYYKDEIDRRRLEELTILQWLEVTMGDGWDFLDPANLWQLRKSGS